MKYKLIFLLLFVLIYGQIKAQNILAGPVVGAVQPNSVTMMVQVRQPDSLTLNLSPVHDFQIQTEQRSHGFVAIFLSELKPYTRYEYVLKTRTETLSGRFPHLSERRAARQLHLCSRFVPRDGKYEGIRRDTQARPYVYDAHRRLCLPRCAYRT